jgi:SAM-dependent MidA family methyltransferase
VSERPATADATGGSVADQIRAEAARLGSLGFDRYLELALYGPGGFFTAGRGAGRSERDFVTSPEVGPLFGRLVGRAIDSVWHELGSPDPFVVVEAGAGSGRLAREVLRADPECTSALRYVLVEVSPVLRDEQRRTLPIEPPDEVLGAFRTVDPADAPEPVTGLGPIVTQLGEMPAVALDGVVLANELLDNLPFALAEHDGTRWHEVRVGADLQPVLVPLAERDHAAVAVFGAVPPGARVPIPRELPDWFAQARRTLRRGRALLVDYATPAAELVARGDGWLRTYRDHRRGHDPFADPGGHDITADVVLEHVAVAAAAAGFGPSRTRAQATWLRDLGIDELVAEGDAIWQARAAIGDLVALEARSRAAQAATLTDVSSPGSLGSFTVWDLPLA